MSNELPVWVGAVALQLRSQKTKKTSKESWQYYLDISIKHLTEKLGTDFNREAFIKYTEKSS